MPYLKNGLSIAHAYLDKIVKDGDVVIDATMGNGGDTCFLCELCGEEGHVYAFDIQKEALENTRKKLEDASLESRATLILDGHQNMAKHISSKVCAIVFNLGYRPGGDHSISTHENTTIAAIDAGLSLLKIGGVMIVVIYHGGDTGFSERDAVLAHLKGLDYKQYSVLSHDFINQPNCPPIAVVIEKLRSDENV